MTVPGALAVVKVGADELVPGPALAQLALWTARQVRRGQRLVLVHGGGDEVTQRADALGLPTVRREGQRVTSDEMLEVVAEVLGGRINLRLTNALEGAGVPAVGLTGVSARILPVRPAGDPPGALGWVGEPAPARGRLLLKLLEDGFTPVLAPLGRDDAGGVYNVNADLAAAAVAGALGAAVFLVSDVPGVLGSDGRPIPELSAADARRLVASGVARDGMVPKLRAALRATEFGAPRAWIGSLAMLGDDPTHPRGGTLLPPRRRGPVPLLPVPTAGDR
jgi:acetylglutamate kinase